MAEVEMSDRLQEALADHKLLRLDMGCGLGRQEGFYGIDRRALETVDLVHDLEDPPYPLPDECCQVMLASHVVEHLKPWLLVDIMNEWWRLMVPEATLMIATPYYTSPGFAQDPTHVHGWSEITPYYFDPDAPLYGIYQPRPWKILKVDWVSHGNLEIVMSKRGVSQ